ncbi:MAG: CRISPR-associated endonuclease Cas2 [Desulfobulbaceae bacterium A2]|nr:MAG: CRISPR-associated endonuclease Cas2 [Desulfobulbaceae bacterium A2]
MSQPTLHLVAYDIEDDRERLRTGKLLEGFGRRVQKSVFECLLDRRRRRDLALALESLELDSGFVLVYRVSEQSPRAAFGRVPPQLPDDDEHAFVI